MVETDNHLENACVDTDYSKEATVKQRPINNRQNGSTVSDEKKINKPKPDVIYILRNTRKVFCDLKSFFFFFEIFKMKHFSTQTETGVGMISSGKMYCFLPICMLDRFMEFI